MSERTHLLVQQWLQQALPHNGFTDNLQQLTQTYPYFSAAHLLLLQKSSTENFAGGKKAAALHVYNPLFLEMDSPGKMFDFPFEDEKALAPQPTVLAPVVEDETTVAAEKVTPVETEPTILSNDTPTLEDSLPNEATTLDENKTEFETTEPFVDEEPINIEKEKEEQPSAIAEPEFNIPKLNLNAPAADITFEPYHTVDYFASQGIKLSQTDATNDQFGKQLKSFTEWLKTMKKLPTTAITHNTDGVGERKVENLAAHSLQNTDIITESMAEVWVKQGNIQKASEVYNKLSLQNPSKKAYFAAKIESLKKPS